MQSPPDFVRSSRWRWCWSPRSPSSSPPSMSCRWTSWARWDACSLKFQFQLWKTNKTFWKVLQLFWNWTLHGEAFSPHNASFEGNLQQIPLGSKSLKNTESFSRWNIRCCSTSSRSLTSSQSATSLLSVLMFSWKWPILTHFLQDHLFDDQFPRLSTSFDGFALQGNWSSWRCIDCFYWF